MADYTGVIRPEKGMARVVGTTRQPKNTKYGKVTRRRVVQGAPAPKGEKPYASPTRGLGLSKPRPRAAQQERKYRPISGGMPGMGNIHARNQTGSRGTWGE